jgi:hypothetical protein
MNVRIATLNLKWKAFRNFFDFAPTDAELARGPFLLGDENGAQVFSKMLSGDQGVPLDLLQIMADRINRQALAHRAQRSAPGPLGDLAITAADLAHATLFDFIRRLVALSPVVDPDRLDSLHRDLIEALSPPRSLVSDGMQFTVERFGTERTFLPFREQGDDTAPKVFEPGKHLGQFSITGRVLDQAEAAPMAYVFVRRDTAPLGHRVWEQDFSRAFVWLPSPLPLKVRDGAAHLFDEPMPVLPEPGHFRTCAVLIRDPQALRRIDPRLDRRKEVAEVPSPTRFDEAASIRFLTNVNRALERRDPDVALATADYVVTLPDAAKA